MNSQNSTKKHKGGVASTAPSQQNQKGPQEQQVLQHTKKKKSKNKNKKASAANSREEKEATTAHPGLGSTEEESLMINGKTLSNELNLQLHIDNQINGLPETPHHLTHNAADNPPKKEDVGGAKSCPVPEHGPFDTINGHHDQEDIRAKDTVCTATKSSVATKKTKRKPNNKKNLPLNVATNETPPRPELKKAASTARVADTQPNEQKALQSVTGSNGLPLTTDTTSDADVPNTWEEINITADEPSNPTPETSAGAEGGDKGETRTEQLTTELQPQSQAELNGIHIEYKEYESELQMHDIMRLIQAELSEPYSIYTYRYFIYNWPKLCFLASHDNQYVGAIVCKLDMYLHIRRGYIAMLAVRKEYRKLKIGTTLVQKAIEAMLADDADEVVLETEMSNVPALRLYENLGFVRDKRLFRYYLNGVDALRLKLWFR